MANGGWVAVHQDITAQKRVEAELAHMARYDALTGLANRALFLEKVNEALARMTDHDEPFSILMLDLDRFKAVNNSLGHAIGDSLLKAVGERLRWLVRDLDVVARLGGDEFAIIQIADTNQRDQAAVLANRILTAITEPYDIDGRKIVIGTSIGITLAPQGCRRCRGRYPCPPCRPRALQVEIRRAQSLSLLPDRHGSGSARPPRTRRRHAAGPVAR